MQVPQSGDGNEYVGPIWQLQFSADDRFLMASDESGFARVWRVADGTLVRSFKANYAALHPNGQVIATGPLATGGVTLWNVSDGQQIRVLDARTPRDIAFSPDGQWLAVGSVEAGAVGGWEHQQGYVQLWHLATNDSQPAQTFSVSGIAINAVAFNPDGQLIAAAGAPIRANNLGPKLDFWPFGAPAQVRLWRVADGALVQTIKTSGALMGFSADGRQLYTSGDGNVSVWRVMPRSPLWDWLAPGSAVVALAGWLWWQRRGRRR